ncbi:MAG: ABC transporter substrate-binding protein [Bacteroidota bacterium]
MRSRLLAYPARLLALSLGALLVACQPSPDVATATAFTMAGFDPDADYFPDKVTVEHAEHFTVSYHGHYKVVRTHAELRAWQSDDPAELTEDVVVLVQRGTPTPPPTGDLADATVLTIPANTIAVNNDGTLAFVEALDRIDQLVAVGGLSIYDDDLRVRAESGEIGTVGYSWHGEPKLEVLLTTQPDIALMTVDAPSNAKSLGRARELGAAVAPTFEWAEPHYLGRAEWVKYTSLFFNAEAEANAIFDEVTERVAALRAEIAEEADLPTVLWGYYSGNGRWMMHQNNLEARLLADAGAFNPFADFEGDRRNDGEPIASEQLLVQGGDADHWIIGDIHSADLPPTNYMSQFAAWRADALYHNYKRTKWEHNAYDYYKTALVRPDQVLADLIALIHPDVLPDHETIYLGTFPKP